MARRVLKPGEEPKPETEVTTKTVPVTVIDETVTFTDDEWMFLMSSLTRKIQEDRGSIKDATMREHRVALGHRALNKVIDLRAPVSAS